MINRKILYGYLIRNGELTICPQEAAVVERVTTLYISGLSYQKIADALNTDHIPFSAEAPLWNKHKVKRLLENPRYTGANGYPPIINKDVFQAIQEQISSKTINCSTCKPRPALHLKELLRCERCGSRLYRTAGTNRRKDHLYLKCKTCGAQIMISDTDLLNNVAQQMVEHSNPAGSSYVPSGEVFRLANAINRGLEQPSEPEDVVSLILQGISARYDCCPAQIEHKSYRLTDTAVKQLGRAVSYITISEDNAVTVYFK